MRPDVLGVIGLGAIGGSVAWQARIAGIRVLGWSPKPAERARAVRLGALDDAPSQPEDVARQSDLLVLAAPPSANEEMLTRLAPRLGSRLVTDVATVKRGIGERAETLGLERRFAGSHPFVVVEGQGFEAARPDVFAGAVVYVCPTSGELGVAREIAHFWESTLVASAVLLDPARHDAQVAWTCHLPRVMAAAACSVLSDQLPPGGSLGDLALEATRAAAEPHDEGGALLRNADNVVAALDALADELRGWRSLLARGDPAVAARFERAAAWRRRSTG